MKDKENTELNSALRKRRDRFARQAHHIIQQEELLNNSNVIYNGLFGKKDEKTNGVSTERVTNHTTSNGYSNVNSKPSLTGSHNGYTSNTVNGHQDEEKGYKSTKLSNLLDVLINGLSIVPNQLIIIINQHLHCEKLMTILISFFESFLILYYLMQFS